jgi:membrane-associated phospholipid phosphatase
VSGQLPQLRAPRSGRVRWPSALAGLGGQVLLAWAGVLVVLALAGVLITNGLDGVWPLSREDAVNRGFERSRTGAGNDLTFWLSELGNTVTIVGLCAVLAGVLRWRLHRWRESILLVCCATGQSLVFLFTTMLIDRERPDVEKLDESPPTSSFPSGHTGASMALYLTLALIVHRTVRNDWVRRALIGVLVLIPIAVAVSRLYRGMHHPSDILGSLLNAALVITLTTRLVDRRDLPGEPAGRVATRESRG